MPLFNFCKGINPSKSIKKRKKKPFYKSPPKISNFFIFLGDFAIVSNRNPCYNGGRTKTCRVVHGGKQE
ncbi:hypothetical protein D7X25_01945 [bacterium 1XD42-8]|nr:hypothetical protein D7X25_01945 [bacterium 1XD42-8]